MLRTGLLTKSACPLSPPVRASRGAGRRPPSSGGSGGAGSSGSQVAAAVAGAGSTRKSYSRPGEAHGSGLQVSFHDSNSSSAVATEPSPGATRAAADAVAWAATGANADERDLHDQASMVMVGRPGGPLLLLRRHAQQQAAAEASLRTQQALRVIEAAATRSGSVRKSISGAGRSHQRQAAAAKHQHQHDTTSVSISLAPGMSIALPAQQLPPSTVATHAGSSWDAPQAPAPDDAASTSHAFGGNPPSGSATVVETAPVPVHQALQDEDGREMQPQQRRRRQQSDANASGSGSGSKVRPRASRDDVLHVLSLLRTTPVSPEPASLSTSTSAPGGVLQPDAEDPSLASFDAAVQVANVYVLNGALGQLVADGDSHTAEQLLRVMCSSGRANTHSYAALFAALGAAERPEAALQVWAELREDGVDIGPAGASALLKACGGRLLRRDAQEAQQDEEWERLYGSGSSSYSRGRASGGGGSGAAGRVGGGGADGGATATADCDDLSRVAQVFEELALSGVTLNRHAYNCYAHLCAAAGHSRDAMAVYDAMCRLPQGDAFRPDRFTYATLLKGILRARDWDLVSPLFWSMQQRGDLAPSAGACDAQVWCLLLTAVARSQDASLADDVYAALSDALGGGCGGDGSSGDEGQSGEGGASSSSNSSCGGGRPPPSASAPAAASRHVYNAHINALSKGGRVSEAADVFARMTSAGVAPDSYTFSALLTAHARAVRASLDQVQAVVADMERWGVGLNVYVGCSLINAYRKVLAEEARGGGSRNKMQQRCVFLATGPTPA